MYTHSECIHIVNNTCKRSISTKRSDKESNMPNLHMFVFLTDNSD